MINCIIIDDEISSISLLQRYCLESKDINIVKTFQNPLEAIDFINNNKLDLIFLDIEMPQMNGLDVIASINTTANIIIITAHLNYAMDINKYQIFDFLLKPFSYDSFANTINKLNIYLIDNILPINTNGQTYFLLPNKTLVLYGILWVIKF